MNIIEPDYSWNGTLANRQLTKMIILHHAAMHGSVADIHKLHQQQGWAGIGYHFYVRQDGTVYSGRPIDKIGAHCKGHNNNSIGICFEGNFERELKMADAQIKSGHELIKKIMNKYGNLFVHLHKDLFATQCPGRYFPSNKIIYGDESMSVISSINDILWELMDKDIITEADKWEEKMEKDKDVYWICYKMANKLRGTLR